MSPSRVFRQSLRMSARRGSIMTLFAVLLFALLPLMALIIHTGFVTLTRRQMQTAVNTAAKEGLRIQFSGGSRSDVSELLSLVFDDDLDTAADSQDMTLGAGPDITLTDGIAINGSNFRASRQISGANLGVYTPSPPNQLQTNLGDETHGDMVAGDYDETELDHTEDPDYSRNDFNPGVNIDAFLVRMRRTNDLDGRPPSETDGIASAGPPIPFLFGRGGSTLAVYDASAPDPNNPDPAALLNRRERGTIVRATAIAQARPVRSVVSPVDGMIQFWEITEENNPILGNPITYSE